MPKISVGGGGGGGGGTPYVPPTGKPAPNGGGAVQPWTGNGNGGSSSTTTTPSAGGKKDTGQYNFGTNTPGGAYVQGTFWITRPRGPAAVTGSSGWGQRAVNAQDAIDMWGDGRLDPSQKSWFLGNVDAYASTVGYNFRGKTPAARAKTLWGYAVKQGSSLGMTPQQWVMFRMSGKVTGPVDSPNGGGSGSNGGGGGSGGGGGNQSRNDISYNFSDPLTAKSLITDTLSSYLGRIPTKRELTDLTTALRTAEQGSPTLSSSTASSPDGGTTVNQTSTTSGGLDAAGKQQAIVDRIRPTAEFQAVQTDSVFRKALDLLGSGGA